MMPGGFFGLLVVLTFFSTPILTRIFGDGSVDEARLFNQDLFEACERQWFAWFNLGHFYARHYPAVSVLDILLI